MTPVISVVIPHFNRPRELEAALLSVSRQSWTSWEVIVVDDASTVDPSAIVARVIGSDRGRVIRQAVNRGPSAARNAGTAAATGTYVAYLDCDDIWQPGKLAAQMKAIEALARPEACLCVTRTRVISGEHTRLLPERAAGTDENFAEYLYVEKGFAQTSSFLLSRRAALAAGFAEDLRQYEDHLFFITAGARGLRHVMVEEPLVTWHNDQRSDRLGASDNLLRAEQFLKRAGDLMTPRATLAFRTRYIGALLFSAAPAEAVSTFSAAFRCGAVSARDLLVLASKCALPRPAVQMLRRSFAR